jgi:hypothetical protein
MLNKIAFWSDPASDSAQQSSKTRNSGAAHKLVQTSNSGQSTKLLKNQTSAAKIRGSASVSIKQVGSRTAPRKELSKPSVSKKLLTPNQTLSVKTSIK